VLGTVLDTCTYRIGVEPTPCRRVLPSPRSSVAAFFRRRVLPSLRFPSLRFPSLRFPSLRFPSLRFPCTLQARRALFTESTI
jgi:hypothetical protein